MGGRSEERYTDCRAFELPKCFALNYFIFYFPLFDCLVANIRKYFVAQKSDRPSKFKRVLKEGLQGEMCSRSLTLKRCESYLPFARPFNDRYCDVKSVYLKDD